MAWVKSVGGFALGLGRQMPGFEPHQPVPGHTEASAIVRLTCVVATDGAATYRSIRTVCSQTVRRRPASQASISCPTGPGGSC
jgi:hypothetical protein